MDGIRFDTLTRAFTPAGSRRGALALLLSATLGQLGWSTAQDAGARNCKKINNKKKRKKCLKKAKGCAAGSRDCNGTCISQSACCSQSECTNLSTPCTNGACNASHQCVQVPNNRCQAGAECLLNGRCATPCAGDADCPSCTCGATKEGGSHCRNVVGGTCPVKTCTSTNDCFQGQLCQSVPACGDRCVVICGA